MFVFGGKKRRRPWRTCLPLCTSAFSTQVCTQMTICRAYWDLYWIKKEPLRIHVQQCPKLCTFLWFCPVPPACLRTFSYLSFMLAHSFLTVSGHLCPGESKLTSLLSLKTSSCFKFWPSQFALKWLKKEWGFEVSLQLYLPKE